MLRVIKIAAVVIAALIAVRIVFEVLSFVTSFWFIVAAVALWLFVRMAKRTSAAE